MSDGSLIDPNDGQLSLPGLPDERAWHQAEWEEGTYTGERLFSRHPQVYHAIVELLGADVPLRTIARVLRVHTKTVMGVREREPTAIATAKDRLSKRLMALGELQSEIAREHLANLLESGEALDLKAIKDLLIGLGIVLDKGLLMGGHVTARVEHVDPEPTHADFNRLVRDITSEIGLGGETPGQKGSTPAADAAGSSAPGEQPALPPASGPEDQEGTVH